MNRAGQILFVLGLVIALVSGFFVFVLLVMSQNRTSNVETTPIVVAFQNISPRTEIVPEQVGMAEWPRALPTPIGAYDDATNVVGKLAVAPLSPGQPIIAQSLVDKGDVKENHSNAALILEKGSVGVAMPVTIKSSVGEAIQAGDRVDVIATFTAQGTAGVPVTQRLLTNMLVLQVGTWPRPGGAQTNAGVTIITLQLKEQDVLVLEYAQQYANNVTLTLRAASDDEILPLEPVTLDYINQHFGYKLR